MEQVIQHTMRELPKCIVQGAFIFTVAWKTFLRMIGRGGKLLAPKIRVLQLEVGPGSTPKMLIWWRHLWTGGRGGGENIRTRRGTVEHDQGHLRMFRVWEYEKPLNPLGRRTQEDHVTPEPYNPQPNHHHGLPWLGY